MKKKKTIHADMLEWFQEWCQDRLFASLREHPSQSFSPHPMARAMPAIP